MKETSKAHARRRKNWAFVNRIFIGFGLDVGCGDDPLVADDWPYITAVKSFDLPDGTTEQLSFVDGQFDFVYSSNCLEHMIDPAAAVAEWLRICKPGGHVIFTVPDFELYEQGCWPSKWNKGHLQRFTFESVYRLVAGLDVDIKKIELVDTRYDYSLQGVDQTYPEDGAEAFIEVVLQKRSES